MLDDLISRALGVSGAFTEESWLVGVAVRRGAMAVASVTRQGDRHFALARSFEADSDGLRGADAWVCAQLPGWAAAAGHWVPTAAVGLLADGCSRPREAFVAIIHVARVLEEGATKKTMREEVASA